MSHPSDAPLPAYNLVLFRSGLRVVPGLRDGESIRLRIPEASLNETVVPDDPLLEAILERTTHLTLAFVLAPGLPEAAIPFLPPSSWPHFPEARASVAGHVRPRDPVVESFRSDDFERDAIRRLHASFRSVRDQLDPVYDEPDMRALPNGATYQRVLWPHDIEARCVATCLDLTLLLAAVVEANGDDAVLLFTGPLDRSPDHAFLGVWRSGSNAAQVLLSSEELMTAIEAGELVPIETTELCHGRSRSFAVSRERGLEIAKAGGIHGIDVRRARPGVIPLQLDYDPHVAAAFDALRRLERERNLDRRESLLLLYGLVIAGGPMVEEVVGTDIAPERLLEAILELLPVRDTPVARRKSTTGYTGTLHAARHLARSSRSPCVREVDLLRAILESSAVRSKVRYVLSRQGLMWTQLLGRILRHYPDQDGDSTWAGPSRDEADQ